MRDVSFGVVNSKFATFKTSAGDVTIFKADLSDQGTPLQYNPAEVSGYVPDLNGDFVVFRKAAPITFTFTLLPYSYSDVKLMELLYKCTSQLQGEESEIKQATVQVSEDATITYLNGTLISGIPGVGANNEGRMESHTYSFMFASMKVQGYNIRDMLTSPSLDA